jgi:hypothetical protein
VLRGDLKDAERMFQQSIEARGASNGRALENLQMVRALKAAEAAAPARVTP